VLGASDRAARRLEIQDAHFAEPSELLLDELALRPQDRVVEMGCGAGSFSKRILRRLGKDGVLIGVDYTAGLLEQARAGLVQGGPARFETVLADITQFGSWLDGADAVVARTMLHHVPMVEFTLGKLRARLKPGTRIGLLEPDFRIPLTRLAYLEATEMPEAAPLRQWAVAINQLYQLIRISPDIGGTLARTLEFAGFRDVKTGWTPTPTSAMALENMLMFYDEVRDRLVSLGIMTAADIDEQQRRLRALTPGHLPPVWGIHRVVCST
jgi:ubiquinone/menaquinone biosynthesis C-methylase UbiE